MSNSSPAVSSNAEWSGDDEYFRRLGLASEKKYHIGDSIHQRKKVKSGSGYLDCFPDELLISVFGLLRSPRARHSCASVCKKWLTIQSHMRTTDFTPAPEQVSPDDDSVNKPTSSSASTSEMEVLRLEKPPLWALGDLSRTLEGSHATDTMLEATVMGALVKGGLLTLNIRGDQDNPELTDYGMETVGLCCAALKWLALSDCPNVGDSSFKAISEGCRLLETLELTRCPKVTDGALQSVAMGCCQLKILKIESCGGIGNAGIKAIAKNCTKLGRLVLSDCYSIGERGVRSVMKHCKCLTTLKLESIGITDQALLHLCPVTLKNLRLSSLEKITCEGLSELTRFTHLHKLVLGGLKGLDDEFLVAFAKVCNQLKHFRLIDCPEVDGQGLRPFLRVSRSLISLGIEQCPNISFKSLFIALSLVRGPLTVLYVKGLLKDDTMDKPVRLHFKLESLTFIQCQAIDKICLRRGDLQSVRRLELSGIDSLRDAVLKELLEDCADNLVYLNLTGCVLLTSRSLQLVAQMCSGLETAIFDGCDVTDKSIGFLARKCTFLQELDVSNSHVTDAGILAVVAAVGPELKALSLSGCEGVSDMSLEPIRRLCDNLQVLNVTNCRVTPSVVQELRTSAFGGHCKILS